MVVEWLALLGPGVRLIFKHLTLLTEPFWVLTSVCWQCFCPSVLDRWAGQENNLGLVYLVRRQKVNMEWHVAKAQGELQSELRHLKGHLQTMKPTEMEASVFLLRNGLEFYLSYLVQLTDYRSYARKQFMQSTCEKAGAVHTVFLVLQFWWIVAPERWQPPSFLF